MRVDRKSSLLNPLGCRRRGTAVRGGVHLAGNPVHPRGVIGLSIGLYLGSQPKAALIVGGGPSAMIGGRAVRAVAFLMTLSLATQWN